MLSCQGITRACISGLKGSEPDEGKEARYRGALPAIGLVGQLAVIFRASDSQVLLL